MGCLLNGELGCQSITARPSLDTQALPEPSDSGIICFVLFMRLMAVIPFSRTGGLVDGERLAICVNVVNGEEGQVGAGLFVIRGCRVKATQVAQVR